MGSHSSKLDLYCGIETLQDPVLPKSKKTLQTLTNSIYRQILATDWTVTREMPIKNHNLSFKEATKISQTLNSNYFKNTNIEVRPSWCVAKWTKKGYKPTSKHGYILVVMTQ